MNHFKEALADLIAEVSKLTFITVDGEWYNIDYYMGGDWKFLAMVTGECNDSKIIELCNSCR